MIVTVSSVDDTAGGIRLLDELTIARPSARKVWADGARLSILCILDMSRKTSLIGVPENYLFSLQPALHGLTNSQARHSSQRSSSTAICRPPVPARAAGHP
ncbi:hypothetical protein ACFRH4_46945 [Streptomyces mirabilis]|uniref:hypothetical protein n=1 Tax=Streptomyces mirabilis TaxID=68239 RepID=UPI00369DBAFB